MIAREFIPIGVKAEILARYDDCRKSGLTKKGAYLQVAQDMECDWKRISYVVCKLRPTVNIAEALLKANAAKLAMRIVRKATVAESIDVLSRANIGVLAPIQKNEGGGGFFISVHADSCGAVKIGAGYAPQLGSSNQLMQPPAALPENIESDSRDGETIDVESVPEPQPQSVRVFGSGKKAAEVRARLAEMRAARGKRPPSATEHVGGFPQGHRS